MSKIICATDFGIFVDSALLLDDYTPKQLQRLSRLIGIQIVARQRLGLPTSVGSHIPRIPFEIMYLTQFKVYASVRRHDLTSVRLSDIRRSLWRCTRWILRNWPRTTGHLSNTSEEKYGVRERQKYCLL